MWLQMPQHDVSKKKVSVVERVLKKLQKIFHKSWSTFHVKILVQRHYVFLTLEKNTKIFIFSSPPEKCEKMSKNKNFKKRNKNRQTGPKKLAQNAGNMCLRDINNFRGKIT
jgi:hypothetical protein